MNFEHLDDPVGFAPDDAFRAAVQRDGRRRRRRRRLALTSGSVATSLVLLVGALGGYGLWRTSGIDRVSVDFTAEPVDLGEPFNLLLIGSDARTGPGELIDGERSDTMLVARVEPAERRVVLLSLPRDLALPPLEGGDPHRLNQAFSEGGPTRLVSTVEQQLGIPISAYAQIGFDGVVQLVDEVGGLPLSVSATVRDRMTGLSLDPSACSTLDGRAALALLRSRALEVRDDAGQWQTDPSGDLGRMARQRAVMAALLPQLGARADTFGGVDAALRVLDDHVTVDERFGVTTMLQLARWFVDGAPPTLQELSLPVDDAEIAGGAKVLQLAPGSGEVVAAVGGALPPSSGPGALPAGTVGDGYLTHASGPGVVPVGPCS